MKKTLVSKLVLIFALFFGLASNAQAKKWTLQECVQYALDNNISIRQADLDSQVAAVDKKDAFGNFLPSINASASHSWNIGLNQNITTGLLENQTVQFTSAGLNANIDIYKGLQNMNRLKRARLSVIAAQYQLSKMKDDVSLNVANAFLQILFNKENLKVQKEQLQNNEKQKQRTEALVDAGSVPRGDLLDMNATVASSQQAVIVAENTLLISKLSLAQLLQLEDFQDFDIADNDYEVRESEVMLQSPSAIFEKAKEERAELKIAKTNLEIAEKDVRIARGAYQPSLQGFYSFSTRASYSDRVTGFELNPQNPTRVIGVVEGTNQNVVTPNTSPLLGSPAPVFDQFSDNKGHSFGVQLNIPILNGLSARNNVERSKIALERSRTVYSQQELDLERNVYTAFTDAKGALKSYESALVALDARTEAFNYAKEKFEVGLMNAFELNQAQTLYVNAQSEVLRTKFDYIFRVKVLEFYFGIPIIQKQ
ncbi:outer membrane protein [Flavobacterium gossypii]|uniref:Outer membrane protein n=2 Tax=Flavobacterium TaxID=237 RepID=A0A495MIW3_9FLAO|nr:MULTISPECIES: TolC family protein [Flavobacterium]MBA9072903.1 outer membrane protein [Flavobacterium gossypii]RKS25916.1 outer membrane protein [Flavobacterium endophyticum]